MARPTPPTGWLAIRAAWKTSSSVAPRGGRLIGLLLLLGVPVLIVATSAMVLAEDGRGSGFSFFAGVVGFGYGDLILPMSLIFLGTGTFGDEWAGGTANYVLGLPVPRWALVVGRLIASTLRLLWMLLPVLVVVYLLALSAFPEAIGHYVGALGWVLAVLSFQAFVYCAIFVCLGLLLRWAVALSFLYVFLFEGAVSKLPPTFATLSVAYHSHNILWQLTDEAKFRPLAVTDDVAGHSIAWSLTSMATMMVVALLVAVVALNFKEFGGGGSSVDSAET